MAGAIPADARSVFPLPNRVIIPYPNHQDSRVTGMTYSANGTQLGNLTYTYDADGRRLTSGGSLAAVALPAAVNGNTFNADNGMTGFNGCNPELRRRRQSDERRRQHVYLGRAQSAEARPRASSTMRSADG